MTRASYILGLIEGRLSFLAEDETVVQHVFPK